jgi:hypothetical protein
VTRKARRPFPEDANIELMSQLGGQIRMVAALNIILTMSRERGLSPLDWSIGHLGSGLTGRDNRARVFKDGDEDNDLMRRGTERDTALENAARRATFAGYLDLLHHLCEQSILTYGPGSSRLETAIRTWPNDRPDGDGYLRLGATLKYGKIRTDARNRDRYVSINTLFVTTTLSPEQE